MCRKNQVRHLSFRWLSFAPVSSVRMGVQTSTHARIYSHMHTPANTCMHACVHTCTHMKSHTHAHTRAHTHIIAHTCSHATTGYLLQSRMWVNRGFALQQLNICSGAKCGWAGACPAHIRFRARTDSRSAATLHGRLARRSNRAGLRHSLADDCRTVVTPCGLRHDASLSVKVYLL